jgi:hypothetical protein
MQRTKCGISSVSTGRMRGNAINEIPRYIISKFNHFLVFQHILSVYILPRARKNCKVVTPPFSYSTVIARLINSMRYGVLNFSNFEYILILYSPQIRKNTFVSLKPKT